MLLGEKDAIDASKKAKSTDKNNFVNWDSVNSLLTSEEFDVVIAKVTYDPNNLPGIFDNVGSDKDPSYMPAPKLMYDIAEACGISGLPGSISEPIYQEVDRNRLMCDLKSDPHLVRMHVGYRAVKQSKVLNPDGTWRESSVCTIEYNSWQYCLEAWSKEEKYTNGYTQSGKYDNKYQTRWARQEHLDKTLKFAQRITETKAHCKTIRELAGLFTGFQPADLKSGVMYFSKIQRSAAAIKMDAMARRTALAHGLGDGGNAASVSLFGPQAQVQIQAPVENEQQNVQDAEYEQVKDDDSPFPTEPISPQKEYAAVLGHYYPKMVPNDKQDRAGKILGWVRSETDRTSSKDWPAAISFLKEIEAALPDDMRLTHNLY